MKKKLKRWLPIIGISLTVVLWLADKYLFTDKPNLEFKILSNEPILSINDSTSELKVTWEGNDLIESNSNISVIVIRVINSGNTDVKTSDYDAEYPLQIKLDDCVFTTVPSISNSSNEDYYSDVVEMSRDNKTIVRGTFLYKSFSINLKPKIIDAGDYFDITLRVLHDVNYKPTPTVVGKISGHQQLAITESILDEEAPPNYSAVIGLFIGFGFGFTFCLMQVVGKDN